MILPNMVALCQAPPMYSHKIWMNSIKYMIFAKQLHVQRRLVTDIMILKIKSDGFYVACNKKSQKQSHYIAYKMVIIDIEQLLLR